MKSILKALFGIFTIICITSPASAQSNYANMCRLESALSFGIVVNGTAYSKINGLKTTILSEPYFTGYKDQEKPITKISDQLGGGLFAHYKFPSSILGLENEIVFSQQGGIYSFENTDTKFNYDLAFRFQFINFLSMLRFYPGVPEYAAGEQYKGIFYFGIGPQFSANVAQERIYYKSDQGLPEFGEDSQQQQQLRNVLKGRNDFGLTGEVGFMIPGFWADLSLRYHYGFTDMIETIDNPYNFKEVKNKASYVQLSFKLTLPIN